nr:hypothetical protein [Heyndrickxia oleronia]
MEQITNGKLTNIEMEMAIDELKRNLPYSIQSTAVTAKVLKAKYDSLVSEGFTEQQAIEIIKVRPLYE